MKSVPGTPSRRRRYARRLASAEQVDRRMRDLRPAGWVIRTNLDMPILRPEQLYLEKIGAPVWERKHRGAGLRQISAKTRRDVYARDRYMCRRCGIGAAEAYPGEPDSTARLTLGCVRTLAADEAAQAEALVTECARCSDSAGSAPGDRITVSEFKVQVRALPDGQQQELLEWMADDFRPLRPAERVWSMYRQLPAELRDGMRRDLLGG